MTAVEGGRRRRPGAPTATGPINLQVLAEEYSRTRGRDTQEKILEACWDWATRLARGVSRRSGTDPEVVHQVAGLALCKAMDRYDPQLGDFESFARATIAGEIRHHLRATVWPVHVSRSLQEHYRTVAIVRDELLQQCGHEPSIVAVADAAHLSIDQTSSAIALRRTCAPLPEGHQTAMAVEDDLGGVAARVDLTQAIRGLDPDELRLLDMRFYQGFTQAEIAQILDTNQVRVSRMLTRVLLRLRALLDRNTGAPG